MQKVNFQRELRRFADTVIQGAVSNIERPRERPYTKTNPTSPIDTTGTLKKSLYAEVEGAQVFFRSTASYAYDVEYGHSNQASIKSLIDWIRAKPVDTSWAKGKNKELSAAFAIQNAITQRGVPGMFYYREAVDDVLPEYRKRLAEAFNQDILASIDL